MLEYYVEDWDSAYSNSDNIAGGHRWPALWIEAAQRYRDGLSAAGRARLDVAYGRAPRQRLDLFLPEAKPKGLMVFVHGGYWMESDQRAWSHLAAGSVDSGYAVAMPTYTLCPDIRISDIVHEVALAIGKAATLIEGPIALSGHSAGGHLVSRMVAATTPLPDVARERIRNVVSISGLHDLRPLMKTSMNAVLRIDESEALAESPALLRPMADVRIVCWAGGAERQEFLRQNALLANIWSGLGAATTAIVEPDRHHFNIVDGLTIAGHPLTRALLGCGSQPEAREKAEI
ncbi:MAG: alpha/beta hydrolase [Chelatococcus sp.]|uniref:alpha/beta hydrolase n=1 Tax=unclassified Chelatococcus TaxID=2638111 RepID=UPI001BD19EF2|nr:MULTISPECIES: alpha/beta hydrolase [unclassified Chelatococcus]CAH1657796.1 Acetyl esterase/lipase [Hyphomicrobiales bacterium]MBS7742259.1 alpha/beta hydrolase [Chelatococcus sp. HY11]MBX3537431.1 alpha/beta hydrolase [Chelatococcus sp.]MBX3542623.1 alpha/beta hydrolase [Chelatococcus sp.]MCO5075161.1 alpha/beta hydrolase [Chelatococcus sp.]